MCEFIIGLDEKPGESMEMTFYEEYKRNTCSQVKAWQIIHRKYSNDVSEYDSCTLVLMRIIVTMLVAYI